MATNHHHSHRCQCHCLPTPSTTCYCCTASHYPPPPPSDPLIHSLSSHHHHHHYQHQNPTQIHQHAPPQNHHNLHTQHNNHYPPPPAPPIHQKHHFLRNYCQYEDAEENPTPANPTVSSLIHRIAALESSLRRRKQSPGSSSLRDAAARTIQTHFRSFLVRRSVTLRHLKDLACIKSAFNHLKSSVSNKTQFDAHALSRESMSLLIKLDSIQGSDPMIRDGKRSISRELIRFMELIDEMCMERQVIAVKNVRFGTKSAISPPEHNAKPSGSRVFGYNERKHPDERFNPESRRKPGVSQIRIGDLAKTEAKNQPKAQKSVTFDENGNVYRLIKINSNPNHDSSDRSESSNGDEEEEEVEEIGVSSKEPEVEEDDSSEMSENEMDPRKKLGTRKNQRDEKEDDSFVFSAPLPATMEYRVDSVSKKQTTKQ